MNTCRKKSKLFLSYQTAIRFSQVWVKSIETVLDQGNGDEIVKEQSMGQEAAGTNMVKTDDQI